MTESTAATPRSRFAQLHDHGCFTIPNPWDVGSAKLLEELGFVALTTTSSGLAWSLGKHDGEVTLDELALHVAALVANVSVPVNVDAERCFSDTPEGVAATVERLASVGAAGCSIEDWAPEQGTVEAPALFAERVAAAVDTAHAYGMLVTARAENLLHGVGDVDESIARLQVYAAAGADVLFAPGLASTADIRKVVDAVDKPVNVLKWRDAFSVEEAAAAGARRVSVGGALTRVAADALRSAASELPAGVLG